MTGYGNANTDTENKRVHVEIKSLNSKFLDLSLRSIPMSTSQDLWIRSECNQWIQRGKASITIQVEELSGNPTKNKVAFIDLPLLKSYMDTLIPFAKEIGSNPDSILNACLGFPGIVKNNEEIPDESLWKEIEKTFRKAMENFIVFREREGKITEDEIRTRVKGIMASLKPIKDLGAQRITLVRSKLETSLKELKLSVEIDQNRFEQELIYYIDKLDFSEEIIRLHTHCEYFMECIHSIDSQGKKLGFMAQEMGREINTIGSKAGDALIQQKVVNMKEDLEKIKEQLANIL